MTQAKRDRAALDAEYDQRLTQLQTELEHRSMGNGAALARAFMAGADYQRDRDALEGASVKADRDDFERRWLEAERARGEAERALEAYRSALPCDLQPDEPEASPDSY